MGVIKQRRVRRLSASLATVWLLPVALLLLISAGASVGTMPLAVASLLALVPVPLYIASVLALDRFEREPPRLLLFAFVWGATGAMLVGTILDELERRNLKRGLVALCVGGGMGIATIIERV